MNFGAIRRELNRLLWRPPRLETTSATGRRGERIAARHLRRRGLRVLGRNYAVSSGEIDLIASDGTNLVFVEVRTRRSSENIDLPSVINQEKWKRVHRAAEHFRREFQIGERPCRFDLIVVTMTNDRSPDVEHFVNVEPTKAA